MTSNDARFSTASNDSLRHLPRRMQWALLGLGLLVAWVYWPGLHGSYVFDDFPNIVNNATLRVTVQSDWTAWLAAVFSSPASDMQRPLAMLSFAINHALTGLDPYWMKLTNLAIHLLNTSLVFALGRRVLQAGETGAQVGDKARTEWAAFWLAAAWALNPINLMGVLFVVQRMESLSHTFVLAGLLLYLVGRRRLLVTSRGWMALWLGLVGGTALGMLAKESAVLLPLYALSLEWALLGFATLGQVRSRQLMATFILVLVAPGVIGLAWLLPKIAHAGAYAGRNFDMGERLLTEARVVVDYLQWTLLPNLNQLSLYHDDYTVSRGLLSPPSTLLALILLVTLLSVTVWLRTRRPLVALGLAWFFVAHLLTATVLPLELVFEHRNYFASLGLCLALGDLLLLAPTSPVLRRTGTIVATAILMLYLGLTSLRAREWSDQLRFSVTEAAKHPQSPRATYDVARNLIILSEYRTDSPYLGRASTAIDRAIATPGASSLTESAAIILASRTARPIKPDWWAGLQRKLLRGPIGPQETASLGALVDCQLQRHCALPSSEMLKVFRAALGRAPDAEVLSIYGNYALNILQNPQLALRLWRQAAIQAPKDVEYRITLAKMFIAIGEFSQAASEIDNVRRMGRLGQNEIKAQELEKLLAKTRVEANLLEKEGLRVK